MNPITFEVVKNRLLAIAEEMENSLMRSAYSPGVKEMRDCSCSLFDAGGQVVAQAAALPMHLGALTPAVEYLLQRHPPSTMAEGDLFITNEPSQGGTHLQDFILILPIFWQQRVVAFAVNLAHQVDIGGMAPGSGPGDATEIFQEGIRIPCLKLYAAGQPNETAFAFISLNVRSPELTLGDVRAQTSACKIGAERVSELLSRYGAETVAECMAGMLDYSERLIRQAIERTPDGRYVAEDFIDDDGIDLGQPIPIRASVEIRGDRVLIDFEGSAPMVRGAINCPYSSTFAAAMYATTGAFGADVPNNAGCYRPVTLRVPTGSILHAVPPAAVNARAVASRRAADVLIRCLSEAVPERAIAGSSDNTFVVQISGRRTAGNDYFHYIEALGGGLGARRDRDGVDGIDTHTTNNMNVPIEAMELNAPLLVERFELIADSGGAGRWRGGLGFRKQIRVLQPATLGVRADRFVHPAPGFAGGAPGGRASCELNGRPLGSKKSLIRLAGGDVVTVCTAGGGGFGDPASRPDAARREDERNGRVSPAGAAR
ncbi:MAG: hydantoinase B/oxoprolinase family protein [Lautropia sp.]